MSVFKSRHVPLQSVSPVPHDVAQVLALHTVPGAHACPHVPQFELSVVRSRQIGGVPHGVVPVTHEMTHLPASQT